MAHECWDADEDLILPETFSLRLVAASDSSDDASSAPSALFDSAVDGGHDEDADAELSGFSDDSEDDDTLGRKRGRAVGLAVVSSAAEAIILPPRASGQETEGGQHDDSTASSKGGTLKALLRSFSEMSLDRAARESALSDSEDRGEEDTNNDTPRAAPSTRRSSTLAQQQATSRLSPSVSALLVSTSTGPGRVKHLGSTPLGRSQRVDSDWEDDLDLSSMRLDEPSLLLPGLRQKASFASHISDETDDEDLAPRRRGTGLLTPSRSGAVKKRGGLAAAKPEVDEGEFDESDFDLPDDVHHVGLSPLVSRSTRQGAAQKQQGRQLLVPPPFKHHGVQRSESSTTEDELEDDGEDSDAAFFEEIVLPSFLGGPGAVTPPLSEGESSSSATPVRGGKIDLQAVLKRKLEARGNRAVLDEPVSGDLKGKGKMEHTVRTRLESFREGNEERTGEHGLDLTDFSPFPTSNSRDSLVPSSPTRGLRSRPTVAAAPGAKKRPPMIHTSSSTATITSSNQRKLPRSKTMPSVAATARPASAASKAATTLKRTSSSDSVQKDEVPTRRGGAPSTLAARKAPPPAPSTAARDRIRQTGAFVAKVALPSPAASPAEGRRAPSPAKVPFPSSSSAIAFGSGATTLARKKSTSNILGNAPTPARLERKTSLQQLSSFGMGRNTSPTRRSTAAVARGSVPSTPTSARVIPASRTVVAPAASRERVISGPTKTQTSIASAALHPPRPSSAAATTTSSGSSSTAAAITSRLTQPTAASRAKSCTLPSSSSTSTITDKPARLPATRPRSALPGPLPVNLRKPKRARVYGDGSELNQFDDLPTSREKERERTKSNSSIMSWKSGAAPRSRQQSLMTLSPPPSATLRRTGSSLSLASTGAPAFAAAGQPARKKRTISSPGKEEFEPVKKKDRGRKPSRAEPQLITSFNEPVAKAHGEMTWNEKLRKWEGNEHVLKEFDNVLSTSTRPALIKPFGLPTALSPPSRAGSLPSVNVSSSSNSSWASTVSTEGSSRGGVKVVGGMVFDPVKMSWFALEPSEEESLDDDFLFADDEDDSIGGGNELSLIASASEGEEPTPKGGWWSRSEQAQLLKTRASFVLSDCEDNADDSGDGTGTSEKKRFWAACFLAEGRHSGEMAPWANLPVERTSRERLYALRNLVLAAQDQ